MTRMEMTRTEFERHLLLYGADFTRWPVDATAAAQTLIHADPAAQQLLREARDLDADIHGAVQAEPIGAALAGQILARVHGPQTPARAAWGGLQAWRWAAVSLALAISVAGFGAGFTDDAALEAANDSVSLAIGDADMDVWSLL